MLKFALVGCGRIAKRHAEILTTHLRREGALVGVCDVEPARARQFAQTYGVPSFTDLHAMMKALPEVDVISVLTPSGLHAAHVRALVAYRKPLIVEKPLALTLEDADAMIDACRRAGVRLFVVLQNRYNVPVQQLREAVEQGRFGRFVMASVRVCWSRSQEYYDQDAWRGTWAMDGGVFANQAIHHLDLLTWMLGDVESVFATTANRLIKAEVPDTGVAVLKFANGALGAVEATVATRPNDLEGSLSILGERGVVEIGGFAVNQIRTWRFTDPWPEDAEVATWFNQNPPDVYGFGHRAFLQEVMQAIKQNRPTMLEGPAGRTSLALVHALHRSAETGREVPLRRQSRSAHLGAGPPASRPHAGSSRPSRGARVKAQAES